MHQIAIIVHRHDPFDRIRYFVREFADVWRRNNLGVTVLRGTRQHVQADLAILHVDLTVVPEAYLTFARRFPRVINGVVRDISKHRISRCLVQHGDGYVGPVIVKTDLNCGGAPEAHLAARTSPKPLRWLRKQWDKRFSRWRSKDLMASYVIYDSPAHVPQEIWRDSRWVVERFLPERSGNEFCLRTWLFLGDRQTNTISYSPEPIVKMGNITRREPAGEIPQELCAVRQEMGFDFGKIDYAIVDGRVVLYDVNRTPTVGLFEYDQRAQRIELLAEGIGAFL